MAEVTREEIRLVPARYRIGKRPLSLLLGWGELTYTRLMEGNTPSPEHAAELRLLLDDPAMYARALLKGRGRVTELAFTRSYKAVDEMLAAEGGVARATRIFAVADRLCVLAGGDLTQGALQRLAYYVQGYSFAQFKSPLFDELPNAETSGPVYGRIAGEYTFQVIQEAASAPGEPKPSKKGDAERPAAALGPQPFTKAELALLDKVYARYGIHSGQVLSQMSRGEAPWRKARKRSEGNPEGGGRDAITEKSLRKFFAKAKL